MVLRTGFTPLGTYPAPVERRSKGMKPTFKGLIVWHIAAVCYQLCQSFCNGESTYQGNTLVDLSHEFDNSTIYWVTAKPLTVTITHNGTAKDKGYWYQSEEFSAATHGGTHLDAPCHFALGRWCVSDIPLNRLVSPAVVIDISDHVKDDPTVHLTTEHIIAWESSHGQIPDNSIILIRTGWARRWPDPLTYSGTVERNASQLSFPSIQPTVAQWIVDNRNVFGLGIDTMSFDIPGSLVPRTHLILEDKNIYGIENLNDNLRHIPPTGATAYVMPMKLKGASGAPCRVLVAVPTAVTNGAECRLCTWNSALLLAAIFFVGAFWRRLEFRHS